MADSSSSLIHTKMTNGNKAKKPLQVRSQQRMHQVVDITEKIIIEMGPENVSIPEIAIQSGVPRASIYQFFPNKYILLTHIAQQHLMKISNKINTVGQVLAASKTDTLVTDLAETSTIRLFNWRKRVGVIIKLVAEYYNEAPAASILILGGPFSRTAYFEHEKVLMQLGATLRARLANYSIDIDLPELPDTITIAVEIAFACMKHGYYRDNHISQATCDEATRAVVGYLSSYVKATQES